MLEIVNICGAEVGIVFASRHQGTLVYNVVCSKHVLERLILDNSTENTGYLLLLSNYCFVCIFQYAKRQKTKYFFGVVWCGKPNNQFI